MKDNFDSKIFQKILNGINSNIRIIDIETDEIVYMNECCKQTFQIEHPEGKACWKVLQKGKQKRCDFCRLEQVKKMGEGKPYFWKEHNTVTGRIYLNEDSIERMGNQLYHVQNSKDITDYIKLCENAATDELTGVLNRKAGKRKIAELLKSMKYGEQFTIVLYDINGLKWVNDTYGHLEGDRLLAYVAQSIAGELSEPDFVFRLSGDEFIILFMNKDALEADLWMKQILQDLKDGRKMAGIDYDVTFSYGLATIREREKLNVSDVLSIVDTQMYIQKRDYHIMKGQRQLEEQHRKALATTPFQYNKEYLFDVLDKSIDDYVFAGNLKTGKFMYSHKMMVDFGLPSQVLENAAAVWGEKIHPEDAKMFLRSNQEIADGRADRHTIVYRAKNVKGEWIHLMCRGQMVRDAEGNPDLFGGIVRNLDKTEADINEELRIISDSSSDGIFKASMTKGFPVLYANEGYYKMHGYTKQQMAKELGNHADVLVYEEDRERIGQEILNGIARQKQRIVLEYRIRKRDGSIAWVHVNAGIVPDDDGTVMMIGMVMDITERRELEERLIRTQQMFKIASKNTRLDVWEFDIRNKKIIQTEASQRVHGQGMLIENVPKTLIENGYIHPDYAEEVREFYQHLGDEDSTKSITVRVKSGESQEEYHWEKVTYTIVRRIAGEAVWAIGISEDVTTQKEAEIRVFEEERLREMLSEDMICSFEVNVTTNCLENFWDYIDGKSEIEFEKGYEGVYRWILNTIADEDDKKRFQQQYAPRNFNATELKEKKNLNFEFQQKQRDGLILWVLLNIRIVVSPETGELFLFGHLKNIDLIKRRELSLKQKAEMDELSSFYNFTTAKLLIEKTLAKSQGESCALVLFDVDNFKEINQKGGFLSGDGILQAISRSLAKDVPFSCIKARANGDMFLLFCHDLNVQDHIREKIEKIRQDISCKYSVEERSFEITVSAGMALNSTNGMTYDQMYQCASYALQAAKRDGKNKLLMYRDIDEVKTEIQIAANQSTVERAEEADTRQQEGMVVFNLLKEGWIRTQRGESRSSVILAFKKYIAEIFKADRVAWYEPKVQGTIPDDLEAILQMTLPGNILVITDEQCIGYRQMQAFYGKKDLPLPLILAGRYEKEKLASVLVLEQVKEKNYVRLLEMITEFMYQTTRVLDLNEKYEYAVQYDQKTGILNYQSYLKYLEQINEDNHSTLGILGVYVVDLKNYNKIYGIKAGDDLLKAVADILAEFFGTQQAFRVSGANFFVVCPNITYEKFKQRCEMVRKRLDEIKTGVFADAKVWGDRVISIEKLQQQVEEKLQIARVKISMIQQEGDSYTLHNVMSGLKEAIDRGEFCTFLQPKANVQTGEICGAEALIRYNHSKKGIISPGRFLPQIEKAGCIRLVDLFVLKDVCRILKKWMEYGWPLFPISLNYSRATILEPGILEETNQIVESAGIPKEWIQIEITETIGSIDAGSLKGIVERFAEAGYKIALDDFGAEYSNIYVLYSLNLSALKLDRRIVSDIYHDKRARLVVENVINMCKKLQIECVAEGVETEEHLGVLKEMSCDVMQGYLLNKPLSETEFEKQYFKKRGSVKRNS